MEVVMEEVSKQDVYLNIRMAVSDEDCGFDSLQEVAEMYWEYADILIAGLIADKMRVMVWE